MTSTPTRLPSQPVDLHVHLPRSRSLSMMVRLRVRQSFGRCATFEQDGRMADVTHGRGLWWGCRAASGQPSTPGVKVESSRMCGPELVSGAQGGEVASARVW
jgi:hypothetical protein